MPFAPFALLIVAAILHAVWNLLLKQANDKNITIYWALILGALCFLPLAFTGKSLSLEIVPLAVISAILQAAYVMILATAYGRNDFSFVYPVSRGAAPAALFVWSALFLGENISLTGIGGLTVLTSGLLVVSYQAEHAGAGKLTGTGKLVWLKSLPPALMLALIISLYSLIDASGIRRAGSPAYVPVVFALTSAFLSPYIFIRYEWQLLRTSLKKNLLLNAVIGVLLISSYGLVLVAFSFAPVGYTGAVRESSIVFGSLAGWLFLGEKFGLRRIIGSVTIFTGILIIALGG